jgi:hypothetical protein
VTIIYPLIFCTGPDTSGDLTAISPLAVIALGTSPDLTFIGLSAGSWSYIGFAATSGGCGVPLYTFNYVSSPRSILPINTADTYVVCYSVNGGSNYTEQTGFGDAFVVTGELCDVSFPKIRIRTMTLRTVVLQMQFVCLALVMSPPSFHTIPLQLGRFSR